MGGGKSAEFNSGDTLGPCQLHVCLVSPVVWVRNQVRHLGMKLEPDVPPEDSGSHRRL